MNAFFLLTLAILPCFAAVAAEPARPESPKQPLLVLRADKEKSVTFSLRENVTTGFTWTAKYDPALCKVEISHRGPENTGGSPVCGAPGKAVVTVTLLTDAPAPLELEYRRPWEKDVPPAKIVRYAVVPKK